MVLKDQRKCRHASNQAEKMTWVQGSYQMERESSQPGKGKNQDLQGPKPNTMSDQTQKQIRKEIERERKKKKRNFYAK